MHEMTKEIIRAHIRKEGEKRFGIWHNWNYYVDWLFLPMERKLYEVENQFFLHLAFKNLKGEK